MLERGLFHNSGHLRNTPQTSPLHNMRTVLLSIALIIIAATASAYGQQTDSAATRKNRFSTRLQAEGVFYNLEYDHPLKPGYTLPLVIARPQVSYAYDSLFWLAAGWHYGVMAGRRKAWQSYPIISLQARLAKGFHIRLGELPDAREHQLPEFLYTQQRAWLNRPEMGAQLTYRNRWVQAEAWVDWFHFVWRNTSENEQFLQGVQVNLRPIERVDFSLKGFVLGLHSGGQLDTTHLPVTTSTNMGLLASYLSPCLGNSQLRVGGEVDYALSRDASVATPLSKRMGWASRMMAVLQGYGLRGQLGYYLAHRFVSLRGEELYSAYSSWSNGAVREVRSVLIGEVDYAKEFARGLSFYCGLHALYDLRLGQVDYGFWVGLRAEVGMGKWAAPLKSEGL